MYSQHQLKEAHTATRTAHSATKNAIREAIKEGQPEAAVAWMHEILASLADTLSGLEGYLGIDEPEAVEAGE